MYKIVITAKPDTISEYFRKMIDNGSLVAAFAWRDLKIKYAQTLIGLGWTIVQPLTALIVYTLFFNYLLHFETENSPYVLFVFSGLSCWTLFNYIFIQGSTSLVQNRELIKKIIFPKMLLPLSKVIVAMVEFLIAFLLLCLLMLYYGVLPSWRLALVVFPVVGIVLTGLSMALLMCAATATYRDLHHLVPFLVNFGIWLTPVFYPVSLVPASYVPLLYLNPITGYLDIFRWCMGIQSSLPLHYIVSIFVTLVVFVVSTVLFIKKEDHFTDKI